MSEKTYFLDTSALFKRYADEPGAEAINIVFAEKANRFISQLTITEVTSNLKRLVEIDRLITETEFRQVLKVFLGDIASGAIYTLDVTPKIVLSSIDLCSESYLTPIDALQLATALSIISANPVFVCSDHKLLKSVEKHGLQLLNPLSV
jgi:predicted nucleic acid-binding protein